MRYDDEDNQQQWEDDHDYKILWVCPDGCGYEYSDYPHCNEAMLCPTCHERTVKGGESYAA